MIFHLHRHQFLRHRDADFYGWRCFICGVRSGNLREIVGKPKIKRFSLRAERARRKGEKIAKELGVKL